MLLGPAGESSLAGGGTGGELPPLGFITLDRDPVSLAEQGTGTLPRSPSKPSSCSALRDRRAPAAHGFPTDALGEQVQPLQTSRSQISHRTQNQACYLFLIHLLSRTVGRAGLPAPAIAVPTLPRGRCLSPPAGNYSHLQFAAVLLRCCSVQIYYI